MAAFLASMSNTELLEICQKWAQKKQQIFFGFTALCAAAGRRLFSFYSGSVWQTGIELNRCAMACEGCGAVFSLT